MPFRNPWALLGLASIVPLIILYLIRPRPRDIPFSALRFLERGEAKRSAALSRLITDPLFWIQLLILISLATAAAGPYITSPGLPGTHLVLVMDVSASMEKSFPEALRVARENLGSYDRVSIVLANNVPVLALREGGRDESLDVLGKLSSRAVISDLSGAMNLANSLLGAEGGDLLVISDFLSWTGSDPGTTRTQLQKDGTGIVFAAVGGAKDNLGIVSGWVEEAVEGLNYSGRIHNYGPSREITITVSGPGGRYTQTLYLDRGGDQHLSVWAPPGITKIQLDVDDGMSADNVAYIYCPVPRQAKVLYLGDDGPARIALQALPQVVLDLAGSPFGHDTVVVQGNYSGDGDLNRFIYGGGDAVYLAQGTNQSQEYLPVTVTGKARGPVVLWARDPGFARGIHFQEIGVSEYLEAKARRGSRSMVEANGAPVLAYWPVGQGKAVYSSLEPPWTDFYQRPEYPIFWYQLMNWLTDTPSPAEANRHTGELVPLGQEMSINTPSGSVITTDLLLDIVGMYTSNDLTLAANLYQPAESDMSQVSSFSRGEWSSGSSREKIMENDLTPYIIIMAALLLLLELAVIRWRREI